MIRHHQARSAMLL